MIKKFNKKLVAITSMVVIGTMIVTGCSKADTSKEVARVNGKSISRTDFDKNYQMMKKTYESQYGKEVFNQKDKDGKTMDQALKDNIIDMLVFQELVIQDAEKQKIKVKDEEVQKQVDSFKTLLGGDEKFKEFLKSNDLTESFFKENLKREMITDKYKEKYIKDLKLTDKEIKEYYDKNKNNLEEVKASHILVDKEEEAKTILNQIKNGANFDELTKKSKEPNAAERKGDLGYFTRGKMVAEFEKAAFTLKPGEISDVVKTKYGYHIIKVTDKKSTLEELKDTIAKQLQETKYNDKMQELKKEAKVDIFLKTEKSK